MQAIIVHAFGEPEVLRVEEREPPVAGHGEVLIAVEAVGVNPVEAYIRSGQYARLPALPYTPGDNAAGLIVACGEGVEDWQPGDRVYTAATVSGAYAELCRCRADQVHALPDKLSFSQGAALGVPAATAYRALFQRGGGRAGERVLVHGASGSVGQAAVQLALDAGMEVFGTAGSEAGLELLRKNRLMRVFNHRQDGYRQHMLAASGGFDLILEMAAHRNLDHDLDLLAARGRVVIIGNRGRIEIDPRKTMGKETDIRGLAIFQATNEELRQVHDGLAKAMASGALSPVISRHLPLAQAAAAHRMVLEDGNCGKIVLLPSRVTSI